MKSKLLLVNILAKNASGSMYSKSLFRFLTASKYGVPGLNIHFPQRDIQFFCARHREKTVSDDIDAAAISFNG